VRGGISLPTGFGLGFLGGGFIGFLNRPTYFAGLYRPSLDDISKSGVLLQDAITPILTYGFVGGMLGLIAAAIIRNAGKKG
jgi:hypothetical protein